MENKDTEKEGFVGMSDTMKQYELEKLVEEEFAYLRRDVGKNNNEFLRHYIESVILTAKRVSALADKQGYMRGVEEARDTVRKLIEAGPKTWMKDSPYSYTRRAYDEVLIELSQAHDAISKLKGV